MSKMFAYRVISGGAITQLAMIVISIGFGNFVAFLTSLKLIPTTVGYIIRKSRIPIGIDIWLNLNESKYRPNCGRNLPRSRPTMMQIVIHRVRYFSKSPNDISESLDLAVMCLIHR